MNDVEQAIQNYRKEKKREYQQRPEVKERKREYQQRPEVKERKREYQREWYQKRQAEAEKETT